MRTMLAALVVLMAAGTAIADAWDGHTYLLSG
jgi:hypothetical protein